MRQQERIQSETNAGVKIRINDNKKQSPGGIYTANGINPHLLSPKFLPTKAGPSSKFHEWLKSRSWFFEFGNLGLGLLLNSVIYPTHSLNSHPDQNVTIDHFLSCNIHYFQLVVN